MKIRRIWYCIGILALVLVSPGNIKLSSGQGISDIVRITPEYLQLAEDTSFEAPPTFVINGSSDEFSVEHHIPENENDTGYAVLNWTHAANTSLNYRPEEDEILPDCYDFVYLLKNLKWNYTVLPSDVIVSLSYNVNRTGDFYTGSGSSMFEIFIWFYDSSGNWILARDDIPVYTEPLLERDFEIAYLDIHDIFLGMVEDEEGMQEDPSDDFQIRIGLAPTFLFLNNTDSEPWRTYNGSVCIELYNLEVHVAADIEPDTYDILQPLKVATWGNDHYSEYNPEYTITENGSVIALVTSSDVYTDMSYHSLVKWDSLGKREWDDTWHDLRYTKGEDIAYYNGSIYTVGTEYLNNTQKDMIITKWNLTGDLVWKRVIDTGCSDEGKEIGIDSDGSIYVLGYVINWNDSNHYTFLAKYDQYGDHLWNVTFPSLLVDKYHFYIGPNREIYVNSLPDGGLVRWNADGSHYSVLMDQFNDVTFDSDGEVYTISYVDKSTTLKKWTDDGELLWTKCISIQYGGPWYEYIIPDSIDYYNDSVYVLLKFNRLDVGYTLCKFDTEGNQLWNKTILDLTWFSTWLENKQFFMKFGNNGLLYIGSNKFNTATEEIDIALAVFNPEKIVIPEITSTTTNTTSTGSSGSGSMGVIIISFSMGVFVIVLIIIFYRRKVSFSKPHTNN